MGVILQLDANFGITMKRITKKYTGNKIEQIAQPLR